MARYKDIELLDCMILSEKSDEFCEGVRFAMEEVDKLPTADVVEVKHGEWIDLNITEWQCSECNYRVERWNNTPYCPECGAKMYGGNIK